MIDDGIEAMKRVKANRAKRRRAAEDRLIEQYKDRPMPDRNSIAYLEWSRVQNLIRRSA